MWWRGPSDNVRDGEVFLRVYSKIAMTRNIDMRMAMATNLNKTAFIEESDGNLADANPRAPMETSNWSPLVGELTEGWPVVIRLVEFAAALGVKPRSWGIFGLA
ncbi:hypothetical protein Adt_27933 [Abeliophyllum distichum]|uniref:Uncharacterized protein n=1 Tax=Abeliophyllum distichum TaxID=126358 RepID=A0ABD1RV49_9LAMI